MYIIHNTEASSNAPKPSLPPPSPSLPDLVPSRPCCLRREHYQCIQICRSCSINAYGLVMIILFNDQLRVFLFFFLSFLSPFSFPLYFFPFSFSFSFFFFFKVTWTTRP